jgi:hypothetical protein
MTWRREVYRPGLAACVRRRDSGRPAIPTRNRARDALDYNAQRGITKADLPASPFCKNQSTVSTLVPPDFAGDAERMRADSDALVAALLARGLAFDGYPRLEGRG